MLNHHLRLKVQYDFIYAIKDFFYYQVDYNYFGSQIVVANWSFSTSVFKWCENRFGLMLVNY
jgi:hypothetical protein